MENKREKQSDAELLEYIFMKYRNGMYAVAFSILHDQYQAEDAVGDACEKQGNGGTEDKDPADKVCKKCSHRHIQEEQTGTGQYICGGAGVADRCVQAHRILYEKPAVQGVDTGDQENPARTVLGSGVYEVF